MTKQTYKRYLEIIKKDVLTESEILTLKRVYNRSVRDLFEKILKDHVIDSMKSTYLITSEQSEKGLNWIRNVCFKKNGDMRNTKSCPFNYSQCNSIRDILKDFSHWTFDGFNEQPIYTMHSKDGKRFTYSVSPYRG